jgi:hypothetical protein
MLEDGPEDAAATPPEDAPEESCVGAMKVAMLAELALMAEDDQRVEEERNVAALDGTMPADDEAPPVAPRDEDPPPLLGTHAPSRHSRAAAQSALLLQRAWQVPSTWVSLSPQGVPAVAQPHPNSVSHKQVPKPCRMP